jgi:hypothetical protein
MSLKSLVLWLSLQLLSLFLLALVQAIGPVMMARNKEEELRPSMLKHRLESKRIMKQERDNSERIRGDSKNSRENTKGNNNCRLSRDFVRLNRLQLKTIDGDDIV